MAKILLVEDDVDLSGRITQWLKFQHHLVETVHDGHKAAELIDLCEYELLILDWNLPGLTGVEVLRQARSGGNNVPVLMLTGNAKLNNKEEGFDAGADDYLTKPFELKELSMRIGALLRRPRIYVGTKLTSGEVELDTSSRKVTCRGNEVHLEPKEFAVLELLMRHKNELFTPEAILERVWSSESESTIDTVRTCVKKLRKKLSPESEDTIIKTLYKQGYMVDR